MTPFFQFCPLFRRLEIIVDAYRTQDVGGTAMGVHSNAKFSEHLYDLSQSFGNAGCFSSMSVDLQQEIQFQMTL